MRICFSTMKKYTKEFETLKGMRTLNWMEHLGEVELDIELDDATKTFKVNPAQATIIMLFQEQGKNIQYSFFNIFLCYHLANPLPGKQHPFLLKLFYA